MTHENFRDGIFSSISTLNNCNIDLVSINMEKK